jgi:hypothetical protein
MAIKRKDSCKIRRPQAETRITSIKHNIMDFNEIVMALSANAPTSGCIIIERTAAMDKTRPIWVLLKFFDCK